MRAIPCPVTPEELHHLYLVEKLTDEKIVERIGQDSTLKRVRSWRKKFGIETINRTERHDVLPIEGNLRSLLVGSMLGDGRLQKSPNTTRYQECHCDEQKEYLEWKVGQWESWVELGIRPVTWNKKDGKSFSGWRVETVSHASLNEWHTLFYGKGKTKKSLQPQVIDYVDSFALAVWFMDDGSAGWWPQITFGMDSKSREIAMRIFAKFSLYPKWTKHRGNTGDLQFNSEDQAHLFISLVKPHIPECMQDKLQFGFQGAHYEVRQILKESVLRDYAARGVPIRRIAKELGVGASTVSRHLEKFGVEHHRTVGRPRPQPIHLESDLTKPNSFPDVVNVGL